MSQPQWHENRRDDSASYRWMAALGDLAGAVLESLPWCGNLLGYHPDPDLQLRVGPLQIYSICKCLGCMEGPVLLFQSCGISVTQGNNRITRRRPGEDPMLMVSQKPEISNQTNDSFQ